jgi:hydrogenase nickel incorporation protein HypA/HybF
MENHGKNMHEFALAEDIVKTIGTKIDQDYSTVSLISIEVGSLSGVVSDSLEFGLQIVMKERGNSTAGINIIQVPARARCQCGEIYELKTMFEECPVCQSLQREIVSGTEVVIKSIEVREAK